MAQWLKALTAALAEDSFGPSILRVLSHQIRLGCQASEPQGPFCVHSDCKHVFHLDTGSKRLDSGPYAYIAHILPTELFLSLSMKIFKDNMG